MDIYLVAAMQAIVSSLMFVAFDYQRKGLNGNWLAVCAVLIQCVAMIGLLSSL